MFFDVLIIGVIVNVDSYFSDYYGIVDIKLIYFNIKLLNIMINLFGKYYINFF